VSRIEKIFGRCAIRLARGDIALQETEAIVNAANNQLWMGAGVAGAIKRRGGEAIEREAVAQGPIRVGEAVITAGGSLAAKWVIHAAAMGDAPTDVRGATRSSLELARRKGVRTVSFPALGTGVAGFPMDECASIMLDEAKRTATAKGCPFEEIRFVLWSEADLEVFSVELERL
jgi:O-acetyl-ADP-ribose deacetylase (regulator of RNase III)